MIRDVLWFLAVAAILVYSYARFLKALQLSCKITIEIRDCRLQSLIETAESHTKNEIPNSVRWPRTRSPTCLAETINPCVAKKSSQSGQTKLSQPCPPSQTSQIRRPVTVQPSRTPRTKYDDQPKEEEGCREVSDDVTGLLLSWDCEGLVRQPQTCKKIISCREERITYKDLNKLF